MNEQRPMPHDVQRTHNDGMLSVQLEQRLGGFHLGIDFRVPLGLIVLFGYSGAGKSLTLQSLAGLQRPKHGSIAIDGQVLFDSQAKIDLAPQARRVGYVPQRYALFPHLTVEQNIRFALPASPFWSRVTGRSAAHKARIGDLLTALELQDLARRYPRNIFGGYIASPPTSTGNQPERPAQALRLNWLQITSAQTQVVGPHCDNAAGCWLPLPLAVHPTQPSSLMLTPET